MNFTFEIGDAVLFRRGGKGGNLIGRCVRLVTGSEFTHCGIVVQDYNGGFHVAEQDSSSGHLTPVECFCDVRRISPSKISIWRRPGLCMPQYSFNRVFPMLKVSYGYLGLVDALINHGIGRVCWWFKRRWRYQPFLGALTSTFTCAGFMGKLYRMHVADKFPTDFPDHRVLEPDDFTQYGFQPRAEGVEIWQ